MTTHEDIALDNFRQSQENASLSFSRRSDDSEVQDNPDSLIQFNALPPVDEGFGAWSFVSMDLHFPSHKLT
jgi:hypothetical protein